jgi:hypothetical protein
MERIFDPQFKKTVEESVSREIYYMLNERFDDKAAAHWDNVKTGVGNVGRWITGRDPKAMVDANAHSQKMNQFRANKKSNAKLTKVQNRVNRRFDSNIAPILQRSGVDPSGVKQELNKAIAANMKDATKPGMDASRRQQATGWNKGGGNQASQPNPPSGDNQPPANPSASPATPAQPVQGSKPTTPDGTQGNNPNVNNNQNTTKTNSSGNTGGGEPVIAKPPAEANNTTRKEMQRKPLVLDKNPQQQGQPQQKDLKSTLKKKPPQQPTPQPSTANTGSGSTKAGSTPKPVTPQQKDNVASEQRIYNTVKSLLRH